MQIINKLAIIYLLILPSMAIAQSNTSPVMMQMRSGKIYFDNTYSLDSKLKKEELYNKASEWFKEAFPHPEKDIINTDANKGEISAPGVFKIITSNSGHYYWIKFTVNITVHNATYELKAFDFYEKPVEPGISNEYSKLEYRWWDFRQGKPWSPEDQTLFIGLDKNINGMLSSLASAMSK